MLNNSRLENGPQRRGTVIVLVIVMLALLAIMGTTFVITSRIERVAMDNAQGGFEEHARSTAALHLVEERIKTTLEMDLWGVSEDTADSMDFPRAIGGPGNKRRALTTEFNQQRLLGLAADSTGTSTTVLIAMNEPWDAPTGTTTTPMMTYNGATWSTADVSVDGDPWLSPIEVPTGGGTWSSVSDWYGRAYFDPNLVNGGGAPAPRLVIVPTFGQYNDPTMKLTWTIPGYVVDSATGLNAGAPIFANVPAASVAQAQRDIDLAATTGSPIDDIDTKMILEQFADADGDGILDSVWLYSRGVFKEHAQTAGTDRFVRVDADCNDDPTTTADDQVACTGLAWPQGEGLPSIDGKCVAVAVRVIDLCGMVNANTAWSWPDDNEPTNVNELWRGMQLSGINLYTAETDGNNKVLFGYDDKITGKKKEPDEASDLQEFDTHYVLKIGGPTAIKWSDLPDDDFVPFDFQDEAKLRKNYGRALPTDQPKTFMDSILPGTVADEDEVNASETRKLAELESTAAVKNRLTTYNFARNIAQLPTTYVDDKSNLTVEDNRGYDLDQVVSDLIYRVKNTDFYGATAAEKAIRQARVQSFVRSIYEMFDTVPQATNYADGIGGSNDATNYRTWQYIANLVDYFDVDGPDYQDDEPTVLDTTSGLAADLGLSTSGLSAYLMPNDPDQWLGDCVTAIQGGSALPTLTNNRVYGVERHAVISGMTITARLTDKQSNDGGTAEEDDDTTTYTYNFDVSMTVANPWSETIARPNTVACLIISKGSQAITPQPCYVSLTPTAGTLDGTTDRESLAINGRASVAKSNVFSATVTVPKNTDPSGVSVRVAAMTVRTVGTGHVVEDFWSVTTSDWNLDLPDDLSTPTEPNPQDRGNSPSIDGEDRWLMIADTASGAAVIPTGYLTSTLESLDTTNSRESLLSANARNDLGRSWPANSTAHFSDFVSPDTATEKAKDWRRDQAAGSNYWAKPRSIVDLIAVPYVGPALLTTNLAADLAAGTLPIRNISTALAVGDDAKVHIDLTGGGLGAAFRKCVQGRFAFSSIRRAVGTVDMVNGAGTGTGNAVTRSDVDRQRLAGVINVNTTTAEVPFALHPLVDTQANNIAFNGTVRSSVADVASALPSIHTDPDGVPNNGDETDEDFGIAGLPDNIQTGGAGATTNRDVIGNAAKFSRIANLITTRSDTFGAYVLIKTLDRTGQILDQERWFMIFDRSMCNQPMWVWNTSPDIYDADNDDIRAEQLPQWTKNPNYRRPTVVFRQRMD